MSISVAAAKVVELRQFKQAILQMNHNSREKPQDFSNLLDLIIADAAAMQFGKEIEGVYELMKEDISNPDCLELCANTLLDFYESAVVAGDHLQVEDAICRYLKLKGLDIIEKCKEAIKDIAKNRQLDSLEANELTQVMWHQSIIIKVVPPNITKKMRGGILKCVQEVLQKNALVDVPESEELKELNTEIGKCQLSAVMVRPLDVILTEAKDYVCQMEGRVFDRGDIGAYLGIVRFLMTTLSTHAIMVKKEREESVVRLGQTVNTINGRYGFHQCLPSFEIQQRMLQLNEAKGIEILRTGKSLTEEPLCRKQQAAQVEQEDYEDTIACYEERRDLLDDAVKALETLLNDRDNYKDKEVYSNILTDISENLFGEYDLDEGDPLHKAVISTTAILQKGISLEIITSEFVNDTILSLIDLKKLIYKDHLEAVIQEGSPEGGDEMKALITQLSLI